LQQFLFYLGGASADLNVPNVLEHALRSCQDFQGSHSSSRWISEVRRFALKPLEYPLVTKAVGAVLDR